MNINHIFNIDKMNFRAKQNEMPKFNVLSNPFLNKGLTQDVFQKSSTPFVINKKTQEKEPNEGSYFFGGGSRDFLSEVLKKNPEISQKEAETIASKEAYDYKITILIYLVANNNLLETFDLDEDIIEVIKNTSFKEGDSEDYVHSWNDNEIKDFFNKLNIYKIKDLLDFIKLYNQLGKNQRSKEEASYELDFLKIYAVLENKQDMLKYPTLLRNLLGEESCKENPDYAVLNEFIKKLKKLGIENEEKSLPSELNFLMFYSNEATLLSNLSESVEYLYSTLEDRNKKLDNIFQKNNIDSKNIEKIKKNNAALFNCISCKYKEEDETIFNTIIKVLKSGESLTSYSKNIARRYFNSDDCGEKAIQFYLLLSDMNIDIKEFNDLMNKTLIDNVSPIDILFNYQDISIEIQDILNTDIAEAQKIYKEFKEFFVSVSDTNTSNEDIKTILKTIQKYNIKDSNNLVKFYKSLYSANLSNNSKTKNKNQTSQNNLEKEEVIELTQLLKYDCFDNILKEAQNKKIQPKKILLKEQEQFLSVQNEINDFLNQNNECFIGKNSFDIYSQFRDSIFANKKNINGILKTAANTSAQSSFDYENNTKQLKRFSFFFNSEDELFNFIRRNDIKFDNKKNEAEYLESCYKILNSFKQGVSLDLSNDTLNYFLTSNFFINSKSILPKFLKSFQNNATQQIIFNIIAKRKIADIRILDQFLKKYKSKNGDIENILRAINKVEQNVDINEIDKRIQKIQEKLNSMNLNFKIDNDNILNFDLNILNSKTKLNTDDIISQLKLNNKNNQNYLQYLDDSFVDKNKKYTKYSIAKEIISNYNKTDESYNKLCKLLKIDKILELYSKNSSTDPTKIIIRLIPNDFVDFINSNEWLYSNDENKISNLSLHAKLRLIDRFALQNKNSINELYTQETKEDMFQITQTIYTKTPFNFSTNTDNTVVAYYKYKNDILKVAFANNGKMLTFIVKDK